MEEVLEIVVLGRACRNGANIKNRKPIGTMYIKAGRALDGLYTDIIREELNVKSVEFTDDVSKFASYNFKPQLKTLGRRFGKNINKVKEILAALDGAKAVAELNENGFITINVDGADEKLEKDDLLIETAQSDDFESITDKGITVVLDKRLSDELIEEGFVREIISKVQTMRKDADFEVMDHICLYTDGNARIAEIVDKNAEEIKDEVLADELVEGSTDGFVKEWSINGENVKLGVKRL